MPLSDPMTRLCPGQDPTPLWQRRALLAGTAALCLGAPAHAVDTLRIGAPHDVADDFVRFIQTRDVATLTHFGGPGARRDVMELAWLLRYQCPDLFTEMLLVLRAKASRGEDALDEDEEEESDGKVETGDTDRGRITQAAIDPDEESAI